MEPDFPEAQPELLPRRLDRSDSMTGAQNQWHLGVKVDVGPSRSLLQPCLRPCLVVDRQRRAAFWTGRHRPVWDRQPDVGSSPIGGNIHTPDPPGRADAEQPSVVVDVAHDSRSAITRVSIR